MIVHNVSQESTPLQLEYLDALQLALRNLSQPLKLQWINVAKIPDEETFKWQMLRAVNSSVTEVGVYINVIPIPLCYNFCYFWSGLYYGIATDPTVSSCSLFCHTQRQCET